MKKSVSAMMSDVGQEKLWINVFWNVQRIDLGLKFIFKHIPLY